MSAVICITVAVLALTVSTPATATTYGSVIRYGPGDKYSGYLVRPEGKGPFPALVVIHEWWGLNENIKSQSGKLADAGYVTLAVDLFGKTTTDPQEAMRLVGSLDQKAAAVQLLAAADYLRSLDYVRPDRVGSIGWCFGGGMTLRLAILEPKLRAAVVYYGQPVTDPKEVAKIKGALIGFYGEADQSIPLARVQEFKEALRTAKVDSEIYTYPGAGHAFANPTRSESFRPQAAADAWKKTLAFLDKHLRK